MNGEVDYLKGVTQKYSSFQKQKIEVQTDCDFVYFKLFLK